MAAEKLEEADAGVAPVLLSANTVAAPEEPASGEEPVLMSAMPPGAQSAVSELQQMIN